MQMYDPNVWGPTFWAFLDIIAFHYPKYPNDVVKKKYYDFIQNIPLFIPHSEMSKQFQTLLNLYPIKPYLDDRSSIVKWAHFIRNKINELQDKPSITIEMYHKQYYEKYKVVRNQKNRVSYIIMIILIAIIIYYYKK